MERGRDEESREDAEMIQSMLKNNQVQLLYDVINRKGEEIEQVKTVYTLFEYLNKEFLDGMRLDYNDVYETFKQRAKALLDEVEEDRPILEEIIDTFLSRMVLNLITQDKVAFKVQDDMIRCLEELYDHREKPLVIERSSGGASKENKKKKKEKEPVLGVKNDFAHYDRRNKEIADRCLAQRNPATDDIDIHFSKAKKRGRHQKIRNELVINTVEAMAGELIEKRQNLTQATRASNANDSSPVNSGTSSPSSPSASSMLLMGQKANMTDYYPIFKETLNVFNRCIPKAKNHGFYLEKLIQCIRTLDSHVWPLHGLMSVANNLNYCVRAETVKMSFDRNVKRFYCCYSGKEIQDGEIVTCIRVVENDAVRLKEWRDNPPSNRKPFEMPEFTRSVGAYYLKKQLCCPSTLFFTEFSDRYKAQFPGCFDTTTTVPVTTKRKRTTSTTTTVANKKLKTEPVAMPVTDLFDSLRPFSTKSQPSMLRIMMRHIHTTLEAHLALDGAPAVWYCYKAKEQYRRNYVEERQQLAGLLNSVTKKSFKDSMKKLGFYTVISCSGLSSVEDDAQRLELTDMCIDAMLDFIEAIVVPERKFALFAASQNSRMMRAFVFHVEQRIKKRKEPNPFLFSDFKGDDATEYVKKMTSIHWLMCCPLLFIILFDHLAREDATGYLRQANSQSYCCKALFKELQLTLI